MGTITISTRVAAPIEHVWEVWTQPVHIAQWCHASDDWHVPHAKNDLQLGGRFVTTMAARDGSAQFDFGGIYTIIEPYEHIAYTMDDGRKVVITFAEHDGVVEITETFDPENENSIEKQRGGWQSILDNFKAYAETVEV